MALAPLKRLVDGPTIVRRARPDDVGACLATINGEATNAVGWSGHAARRVLASVADGSAAGSLHVVIDVATDGVVGVVDVALDLSTLNTVRLGGWIAPGHRGQGHMRRAVEMVTDYYIRNGVSVRAEAAWGDEAAQAVLVGAGLAVEGEDDGGEDDGGEDDGGAPQGGVRRVAFGRYVVPQQLAPAPSIDDLRKKVARHRTGRRFLLIMIAAVGGLLAFLVISPMWDTEVGDTTVSCGWLFRPASGLTGRAESFCTIGRLVWGSMTLIVVVLLGFLTSAYHVTNPRRRRSKVPLLSDGDTAVWIGTSGDGLDAVDTIDDEVMAEMGWTPDVIGRIASNFGASQAGGQLIVTSSRGQRPIGVISVSVDPGGENQHRIGFWMHADHRRQGHMTRALRLVADHLTTLSAPLIAETGVANLSTQNVLGRAGFVRTGQRRVLLPNDENLDAVVYERQASDETTVDS